MVINNSCMVCLPYFARRSTIIFSFFFPSHRCCTSPPCTWRRCPCPRVPSGRPRSGRRHSSDWWWTQIPGRWTRSRHQNWGGKGHRFFRMHPTSKGGMQKWMLSWNRYTYCVRVFCTFGIDLSAQSVPIHKISCSSSVSLIFLIWYPLFLFLPLGSAKTKDHNKRRRRRRTAEPTLAILVWAEEVKWERPVLDSSFLWLSEASTHACPEEERKEETPQMQRLGNLRKPGCR